MYIRYNLKLRERKDGIGRMKESLFKYLGMSVVVANASSTAEIVTMKTCVRSACYTERYLYAILRAFPQGWIFLNGYFGQEEVKKARSSLSDEF